MQERPASKNMNVCVKSCLFSKKRDVALEKNPKRRDEKTTDLYGKIKKRGHHRVNTYLI